jgi:cytochrome c oxidase subunit 2
MKVHTYEKAFLTLGAIVLLVCASALIYATVAHGIHLPGVGGRIDPAQVLRTPPFDSLGVRQVGPGRYQAVVIAQAWAFLPGEIRVPRGSEVEFVVTASDVLHGFNVEGTRVNMMAIPGQVSRAVYRFDRPGEHLIICHEYCGLGHHTMAGKVVVE